VVTPKQIQLVRSSWAAVAPIQQQAAAIFYDKLFAADPSLRALFKSNMQEQQRKLMSMIGVAVAALDRLEAIVPAVRELGHRHVTYGVLAPHYALVATALLATLEQGLGAAFTVDVREAWTAPMECSRARCRAPNRLDSIVGTNYRARGRPLQIPPESTTEQDEVGPGPAKVPQSHGDF
jgi:hemoglobin-like flavoprotein